LAYKTPEVEKYLFHRRGSGKQYVLSVGAVLFVALLGLLLLNLIGYQVVALMLLVTVSVLAMFLDIMPVLLSALLSAIIWDFFFIPPRFTLTVGTPEDRILLLMYFIIAMINAVLTYKIRQIENEVKAKDEKAKSIKFYNTLLYSLSHELRTPITTILGSTDNLQNNSQNLSERDKAELLSEISIASIRLNHQVENLLNLSRLESGFFQIKKDWCDINELIHKTLNRLEGSLQKYRVAVHIPEQFPLFKLDFGLMEQVIYNLVVNATKHTPENTTITIQASNEKDRLVLTVADNGKGFPEDDIVNVFEKFYRLRNSGAGGSGLGLSIVKGFVEAHHGTVKLQNLPVCGSKFTIEIPTEKTHINKLKDE
jgi:two-component system, OmpR family, sensor histidine kinase KdpD